MDRDTVQDPSHDEFEALVRNEWRRRLGRASYARTHGTRLISTLASMAVDPENEELEADLAREVVGLIAELRAEGSGWGAVRHEAAKLVHAIRTVLRDAGADATRAAAFVQPARAALETTLGFPTAVTRTTGFAG